MTVTKKDTEKHVEEIRSYIRELLPKSIADQYVKLLLRDGRTLNKDSISKTCSRYNFQSEQYLLERSARIYQLSQHWEFRKHSEDWPFSKYVGKETFLSRINSDRSLIAGQLFQAVHILDYRDGFEIFEKLKPEAQYHIYKLITNQNNPLEVYCYMKMLWKAGLNLNRMFDPRNETVKEFVQYVERSSTESSVIEKLTVHVSLPLQKPLSDLLDVRQKQSSSAYDRMFEQFTFLKYSLILLLVVFYGDKVVGDVIERLHTLNTAIDPCVMMDIIDDWDSIKDFPADWIVNLKTDQIVADTLC